MWVCVCVKSITRKKRELNNKVHTRYIRETAKVNFNQANKRKNTRIIVCCIFLLLLRSVCDKRQIVIWSFGLSYQNVFFALIRKVHSYMSDTLTHSQHCKCISYYYFFIIIVFYNYESLTEGFFFWLFIVSLWMFHLYWWSMDWFIPWQFHILCMTKLSNTLHLPTYLFKLYFFSFLLLEKYKIIFFPKLSVA